jgi:hypothetical protein
MIMAMDYNDSTPPDYQAPLFHQGDEHASRLINLGHFSENHVMKTGFHRYAWKIPLQVPSMLLTMQSVAVGLHLPGTVQQPTQTSQHPDNGDHGPSRITRHMHDPSECVRARQHSVPSELEGGHTQPEAMRQIGKMVRLTPS